MKKLSATGGIALGLTGFGLCGGIGTAMASPQPDSGTYDEMIEVHDSNSVSSIADSDATEGDFDGDGLQADLVNDSASWTPGWVSGH